jgi:16S rRNA processing protein RimM
MKPDQLVAVAQIAGAFGVRGEVRVRSFTEDPEACFSYGPLMDAAGNAVLTPLSVRPLKDVFGVTAKERRTREDWEALKGTMLHVPRAAMPAPQDEDEIYVVDLIGCTAFHLDGRRLGDVKDVQNFGAGDLLEIQPPDGPSFLLPFTRAIAPQIDLGARRVWIDAGDDFLPEPLQRQASDGGTKLK